MLERKIEKALEEWFRAEGWALDARHGDHFAEIGSEEVDLSDLARHLAQDIAPC